MVLPNGQQLLGMTQGQAQARIDAALVAAAPPIQGRILLLGNAIAITDAPAAETEFQSPRYRALVDLSKATQIRLIANIGTQGSAGTALRLQWCATEGGTYLEFAATNQPSVAIDVVGVRDSGWVTIPAGAKAAEVYIRLASVGGNATADPVLARTEALIR